MLDVKLSARDIAHIRFAHSPLWEVVASIRVLKSPTPPAVHRPWLDRARPALAAARLDLSLLSDLIPVPTRHLPAFLAPPPTTSAPKLAVELAALRAMPADRVRVGLRRALGPRTARLDGLYDDPEAGLAALAADIEAYWGLALEPYWPRIRRLCDDDVLHRARRLAEGGVNRLFEDLSPQVTWADGRLTIDYPYVTRTDAAGGQGLVLNPSVFAAPRIFSVTVPPWQPTIRYPPRGIGLLWTPRRRPAPEALARVVGRSRARLLAELDVPVATAELAHRTGLTPGAVSQHLGALRAAGFVSAHRAGRYVLYARTEVGEGVVGAAE